MGETISFVYIKFINYLFPAKIRITFLRNHQIGVVDDKIKGLGKS